MALFFPLLDEGKDTAFFLFGDNEAATGFYPI